MRPNQFGHLLARWRSQEVEKPQVRKAGPALRLIDELVGAGRIALFRRPAQRDRVQYLRQDRRRGVVVPQVRDHEAHPNHTSSKVQDSGNATHIVLDKKRCLDYKSDSVGQWAILKGAKTSQPRW